MKVDNFIKNIEDIKKKGMLDLSLGEDLSIGIMNLVSLEEHFLFSFVKTNNDKYLPLLEQTRELRKRLLKKIVRENDAEDWCISKHLLASTMRLTEVGTKFLHDGKNDDAKEMFIEAFNLYTMFWAINTGIVTDAKPQGSNPSGKAGFSKMTEAFKKLIDCCKE